MQHQQIIGATRTGKTNYMKSLLSAEEPFCFIDKHGQAARELVDAFDCLYWRARHLDHTVSFNALQNVPADLHWLVADQMASMVSDIWKLGFHTPNLLDNFSASVMLLLPTHGTTLLDVECVLSDEGYRSRLYGNCRDARVLDFWRQFDELDRRQQSEQVRSTLNKMHALSRALPVRFILGQQSSTIDFLEILEWGNSLVLDLSGIGDEPAKLIGAAVINGFKQAADARFLRHEIQMAEAADTGKEPDPLLPYYLYIDEFQNFGTSIIDTILSESGKTQLWLVLAHQFMSQLDPRVRDSVLGNCSTIVSFRVGPEDAPIMARALGCEPQGLMDLPRGHALYRTLVNGTPTEPLALISGVTELPTGKLACNIRRAINKVSRPRDLAEGLIKSRY